MASIVQRLTDCSISGRHISIHIHKYDENLLLLFWKDKDHKRCYTHVLERKFLEISEFTLLQNHMYHSGLPGTLLCLSSWEPCKWNFPSCPFLTSWHTLSPRYRRFSQFLPDNQLCKCPMISNFYDRTTVTVSIFCINRHRKFTSRIPHSARQWIWSRYELDPASRTLNL